MLKREKNHVLQLLPMTPSKPPSFSFSVKSLFSHFQTTIPALFLLLCFLIPGITFLQSHIQTKPLLNLCQPPEHLSLNNRNLRFDFLNTYIRQHQEQRACLISDSCFPKPKVLIWQCPSNSTKRCAGVGDRMRGIQFTLLLAIATNRLFFLSWPSEPYPVLSALQPNLIDWRVPLELGGAEKMQELNWFYCHGNRTCEAKRKPALTSLPAVDERQPDVNLFDSDIEASFAPHDVVAIFTRIGNAVLPKFLRNPHVVKNLGQLQDSEIVPLVRDVFSTLFRASPAVENVIDSNNLRFRGSYTSIHARTGLDVAEEGQGRFRYVTSHLRDSAQKLLSCATTMEDVTPRQVFVAADSQEIKEYLAEEGMRQGARVKFIPDKAVHIGLRRSGSGEMEEMQRCRAFLNIFADLFMMAGGRGIVTTGSNFANLAYMMGSSQKYSVLNLNSDKGVESQCMPSERDAGWRIFFV